MQTVFVDTGAFYAALNRRDQNHTEAVEEICVSTEGCIPSVMGGPCDCAGSSQGTCVDFVGAGIDVTECGTCGLSYNACCADEICVNATCQGSCP